MQSLSPSLWRSNCMVSHTLNSNAFNISVRYAHPCIGAKVMGRGNTIARKRSILSLESLKLDKRRLRGQFTDLSYQHPNESVQKHIDYVRQIVYVPELNDFVANPNYHRPIPIGPRHANLPDVRRRSQKTFVNVPDKAKLEKSKWAQHRLHYHQVAERLRAKRGLDRVTRDKWEKHQKEPAIYKAAVAQAKLLRRPQTLTLIYRKMIERKLRPKTIEPDFMTQFLSALNSLQRPHLTLKVFERMLNNGATPDLRVCGCIMSAFRQRYAFPEKAEAFMQKMQTSWGLEPNETIHSEYIQILGNAGKLEEAIEYFDGLADDAKTIVLYGSIMSVCKNGGPIENVLGYFDELEENFGVEGINPVIATIVSQAYVNVNDPSNALVVLDQFEEMGVPMNRIHLYVRASAHMDLLLRMVSKMKDEPLRASDTMELTSNEHYKFLTETMIRLAEEMKIPGEFKRDVFLQHARLTAYVLAGEEYLARRHYAALLKASITNHWCMHPQRNCRSLDLRHLRPEVIPFVLKSVREYETRRVLKSLTKDTLYVMLGRLSREDGKFVGNVLRATSWVKSWKDDPLNPECLEITVERGELGYIKVHPKVEGIRRSRQGKRATRFAREKVKLPVWPRVAN